MTPAQINAWSTCKQQQAAIDKRNGVLVWLKDQSTSTAIVRIERKLPDGVGTAKLSLKVTNGTIEGKSLISMTVTGSGGEDFVITRTGKESDVKILANLMNSYPDSLQIQFDKKSAETSPAVQTIYARSIYPGGFVRFDADQQMIVSAAPVNNGTATYGGSENFSFDVDLPKPGFYQMDAMLATGQSMTIYAYIGTQPIHPCSQSWSMEDATAKYFVNPTGGWDATYMSKVPQVIGSFLMPRGRTRVTISSKSCGGGEAQGRLPSIHRIRFVEVQ